MIDPAPYLDRMFDWDSYACWDFTREVWRDITGVDLGDHMPRGAEAAHGVSSSPEAKREHIARVFGKLLKPCGPDQAPCVVLLEGRLHPHFGVLLGGGSVLHLPVNSTARVTNLRPLGSMYGGITFWR